MALRASKRFKCLVGGQEFVNIRLRLQREGCTNREYFKIVCSHQLLKFDKKRPRHRFMQNLEELGWLDYFPNSSGMRLCALDVTRIKHWLALGVHPTTPVAMALGLAGILPVHPESYLIAARNRAELSRLKQEAEGESEEDILHKVRLFETGDDKEYFTTTLDVSTKAVGLGDKWKY